MRTTKTLTTRLEAKKSEVGLKLVVVVVVVVVVETIESSLQHNPFL